MSAWATGVRGGLAAAAVLAALLSGCKKDAGGGAAAPAATIRLTLDWKPEPEFGGFYQAELAGGFKSRGLDVAIKSAGEGATTWQLVDTGQTEFATTAADQVLIARSRGADIVAVFAVYQTSPQGIMVHQARGFNSIQDVWTHDGTLAVEDNAWVKFLSGKFGSPTARLTGYSGGVAAFLAKSDYSQQCFVTSEPLQAQRLGGDPRTFLVAEAGYNPYTTVLITRANLVRQHPERVKAMVEACREGWRHYLDDPRATNARLLELNKDLDEPACAAAAAAQKPLIDTAQAQADGLGSMTLERWKTLAQQLVELKVLEKAPPAEECFAKY